jgi:nucleotide sugar dehydrogenase
MKILIIGAGVVGTATGEGFKRLGHDVYFYDISKERQDELIKQGHKLYDGENFLMGYIDVFFICVEEWNVDAVFKNWFLAFKNSTVVVRSTVPPGTCKRLSKEYGCNVMHNPEFLREATALHDFMHPDKIVIGTDANTEKSRLADIYGQFNAPIIFTDTVTSEFLKLASNAVLSSYISMWNQLKLIGDKIGVNTHEVAQILSLDPRISRYGTIHGHRYAGFCLPKDMKTLSKIAQEAGANWTLLDAIRLINEMMPE